MNERIRELAEQAGYLPDMFGIGHWDMPECKKFAELIINECAQSCLAATEPGSPVHLVSVAYADAVRRHFGVAE